MVRYSRFRRYRPLPSYRSRRSDPYKLRPRRGSGGGGSSPYRPVRHQFQSSPEKYNPLPKPEADRWILPKKEPSYTVELPPYRPEPDIEAILKLLENKFDEKLEQEILERAEREFQIQRTELLREHGLKEYEHDLEDISKTTENEAGAKIEAEHLSDSGIADESEHDIVSDFHNHEAGLPPEEQFPASPELLEFELATDPLLRSDIEALLEEAEPEEETEAVESGY